MLVRRALARELSLHDEWAVRVGWSVLRVESARVLGRLPRLAGWVMELPSWLVLHHEALIHDISDTHSRHRLH